MLIFAHCFDQYWHIEWVIHENPLPQPSHLLLYSKYYYIQKWIYEHIFSIFFLQINAVWFVSLLEIHVIISMFLLHSLVKDIIHPYNTVHPMPVCMLMMMMSTFNGLVSINVLIFLCRCKRFDCVCYANAYAYILWNEWMDGVVLDVLCGSLRLNFMKRCENDSNMRWNVFYLHI